MTVIKPGKDKSIGVIPTGLPQLDKLTGIGGYPRKYMTMLSGQGGVGKTTLAIQTIKEAQKLGIRTLYVETDYKFVPSYFESLGIDLSKITVIQDEVGETVLTEMVDELRTGKYGLAIVDTISKVTPRSELEKNFDEITIGRQAMLIGRFTRKLKPIANCYNVAVLLLNHERIDFMNNNAIKTPGGVAIQEDVVLWIRLSYKGNLIKSGDTVVGKQIWAKVWRKNQVAATEGKEVMLEVIFGDGFSPVTDLIDDALTNRIIEKKGNSYFLDEERIAVGLPKLREALKGEIGEKIIEFLAAKQ